MSLNPILTFIYDSIQNEYILKLLLLRKFYIVPLNPFSFILVKELSFIKHLLQHLNHT